MRACEEVRSFNPVEIGRDTREGNSGEVLSGRELWKFCWLGGSGEKLVAAEKRGCCLV